MSNKIHYIYVENNEILSANLILRFIKEKKIIFIQNKSNILYSLLKTLDLDGPAVILRSSGSSKKSKLCIHPITNFNKSAESSGLWLKKQGFNLSNCFIFNTLPLNHISGFMPLWRSKVWHCQYTNIPPDLIKRAKDLLDVTLAFKNIHKKQLITSLVPTQLYRLLQERDGLKWLKMFDLIWVGGSKLTDNLFKICKNEKINLAPCYGSTETAAMVTSLKPIDFLNGYKNYGKVLEDINLKINNEGIIEIKSERIGYKLESDSKVKAFTKENGWWESGDYGELITIDNNKYLEVIGRRDNAFHSGGETIFPDIIRSRVNEFIIDQKIPIQDLMIYKTKDEMWGNRYEIIINFKNDLNPNEIKRFLNILETFSKNWPKHERPKKWRFEIDQSKFMNLSKKNWKNYI
tara:strand:- start:34578 stop:35792 length:1215 start_codon:yes stop_codon:yes gene_type:complete